MQIELYGPRHIQLAWGELGTSERPGDEHNPRILEYHSCTKLKATTDEVAWCSAFVCWAFERSGIASTRSAAARSWLDWGKEVYALELGCVAVFTRGPTPGQGHVAFPVGTAANGDLVCLGGNQGNRVSVAVYPLHRLLSLRAAA